MIDSHEKFIAELKAAPQDISLPVFQDLMAQGYVDYVWNVSPSATDAACLVKSGDRGTLIDLTQTNLQHNACIFGQTHPGCHCTVTVSGPGLPEVVVGAFGIQ